MINYLSSLAENGKIRTSFCLFDGKKCKPDTLFVKKDYRNVIIMEGVRKRNQAPAGAGVSCRKEGGQCGMSGREGGDDQLLIISAI